MRAISILEVVVVVVVVIILSILKAASVDFVTHLKNVAEGNRFGLRFDPVWFVVQYSMSMDMYHHS